MVVRHFDFPDESKEGLKMCQGVWTGVSKDECEVMESLKDKRPNDNNLKKTK